MKTIGIVGGGQLGKMLTQSAHKLGFKVIILESTKDCPASSVADEQILGSFKDKDKILELAEKCDVITFEIESANAEALDELVANGKEVHPSPQALKIIKDKFGQKVFLKEKGIPVADFALIDSAEDAEEQGEIFGYPFLLKTRFDAYDGRGNFVVKNKEEIKDAIVKFGDAKLYAEKFFPFVKELAVVSARGKDGTIVTFPVVETIHKNNICHIVRSPAQVEKSVSDSASNLAYKVLDAIAGVGVFAIEMFLAENGEVVVNEIAPRVHNSGHLTIEAFDMSQFEAHVRAITGMPLVTPKEQAKASVMVNILGERDGEALAEGVGEAEALGGTHVHIYGKLQTRKERKMGHITATGDTVEEAESKALKARGLINI
jgi:phosphoribosylaminoimidazole carboxylase PurK protein